MRSFRFSHQNISIVEAETTSVKIEILEISSPMKSTRNYHIYRILETKRILSKKYYIIPVFPDSSELSRTLITE